MKKIYSKNKAFTIISRACVRGFTIIELLITISIMGLLLTVGLVYYQDFNRRQIVVQGANDLKNNLRLAQSKALSGEKGDCEGTFGGYQVDFSSDEYVISVLCDGIPVEYRRYPLKVLAWAGGPPYLIFKPLAQGVENPEIGPAEITLSSTNYSSEVTVSEGGEISVENDVPYVPPLLTCVEEGEIGFESLGGGPGEECCPGLESVLNSWPEPDSPGVCGQAMGRFVCVLDCGDDQCTLGENECNCPSDCDL